MTTMEQKDRQLLIQALCALLSYGVKVGMGVETDADNPYTLLGINPTACGCAEIYVMRGGITCDGRLDVVKPFLRPMSSMTEEEFKELTTITELQYDQLELRDWGNGCKTLEFYLSEIPHYCVIKVFDWLNSHHFDYRGLIEKGLAIAVTEENNPYKD